MNVLHVSSHDLVGQRFNGLMLHKALRRLGHDSHMAVMKAESGEPGVHPVGGPVLTRLNALLAHLENRLSLRAVLPTAARSLYRTACYRRADIVHLQLLHPLQFFSLLSLPRMSRRHRVVWTVHDPWLLTGHCVHPLECEKWQTGCGECPDLERPFAVRRDRTALAWRLKRSVMRRSRVELIVASRWMRDMIRHSPILCHLPCHVIPFGIDTSVFRPGGRAASRRRFGISEDAHVLAFTNRSCFKGTEYTVKALATLEPARPTYLLTFGTAGGLEGLRGKYNLMELGWVDEQETIVHALCAADLFLMPSTAESFGLMAVEAMACGTPVIVFEDTVLPEVVHAPAGGVAVAYRDYRALARAVSELLGNPQACRALSDNAVKISREEYALDKYVRRHLELYESLLQEKHS